MDGCNIPGMAGEWCLSLPICFKLNQLNQIPQMNIKDQRQTLGDIIGAADRGNLKGCLCVDEIKRRAQQMLNDLDNPQ